MRIRMRIQTKISHDKICKIYNWNIFLIKNSRIYLRTVRHFNHKFLLFFLFLKGPILTCLDPDPDRWLNWIRIQSGSRSKTLLQTQQNSGFTALNSNSSHIDRWSRLTGKELDDGEEGEDDPVGEPLLVVLLVQRLQRLDRAECRVRESAAQRAIFILLSYFTH